MSNLETCALCPRLCRTACPVVTAVGREAAVPTLIAAAVYAVDTGQQPVSLAQAALGLCVDCGACEQYCHISQPLPSLLREARLRFDCESRHIAIPLIHGDADLVAVETDGRSWSKHLSTHLGIPVARWAVDNGLGVHLIGTSEWSSHRSRILGMLQGRKAVVAHGTIAAVLTACDASFVWLHELLPELKTGVGSCQVGDNPYSSGCCGGSGPLYASHPQDAIRMGQRASRELQSAGLDDSRCAAHLGRCGVKPTDAVARLLGEGNDFQNR